MRALIFNHHPDYTYHIWKNLTSMKIDCFFATEKATLEAGAKFSSTLGVDNKFQLISNLFYPHELFEEMIDIKFTDELDGYDFYVTIDPDISNNKRFKNMIWGAVVQPYLAAYNDRDQYIKITSVQSHKEHNAEYLQYFVPQKGQLKEKKYITQLVSSFNNTPNYIELLNLKQTYPVIIAGSTDAPDGIVNDWETLQNTALLVHEKSWGTNCNAVCKALDTGVPVYMSRSNKNILGFNDLPDFMFIYSDHYSVEEAYKVAMKRNSNTIQKAYRELRNNNLSRIYFYDILNKLKI